MFTVPYPPVTGNTMVRHGRTGKHYVNSRYAAWRNEVRAELESKGFIPEKPHDRPCHLYIVARPPDLKQRDCDNVLKVLFDALIYAGVIADDNNRILKSVRIEWADYVPKQPGLLAITFTGAAGD